MTRKLHCADFTLIVFIFWGSIDLIKNWQNYGNCVKPLGPWLVVSMFILVGMRVYQRMAHSLGYQEKKEALRLQNHVNMQNQLTEISIVNINWPLLPILKKLSYIQFIVFAFFFYWTLLGTSYFGQSNDIKLHVKYKGHKQEGHPTIVRGHPQETRIDGFLGLEEQEQFSFESIPEKILEFVGFEFEEHTFIGAGVKQVKQNERCIRDGEAFTFLVFWFVMNYIVILVFFCLLITWHDVAQRTVQTRKTLLEIIRQVSLHDQEGLDILENAIDGVKEVISRRQEFVHTLNECGIFLMQRGITTGRPIMWMAETQQAQALEVLQNFYQDFRKIRTIVFLERYRDLGHGRCNICLRDFSQLERVKRFPRECDHIFHIKCLEVWMKIEASCPTCGLDYLGHEYHNIHMPRVQKKTDSDCFMDAVGVLEGTPEHYSIFNQWKIEEQAFDIKTANGQFPEGNSLKNPYVSPEMQEYQAEFDRKQFSVNPFDRLMHQRHQKYMKALRAKQSEPFIQKQLDQGDTTKQNNTAT